MKPASMKPACTKAVQPKHIPCKVQKKLRTASWRNSLHFVPSSVQKAANKKRLLNRSRKGFPLPAEVVAEILIKVSTKDAKSMSSVCSDLRDKVISVASRVLPPRVGNKNDTAENECREIGQEPNHYIEQRLTREVDQNPGNKDLEVSENKIKQTRDLNFEQQAKQKVEQQGEQQVTVKAELTEDIEIDDKDIKQEEIQEAPINKKIVRFSFKFNVCKGQPLSDSNTDRHYKKPIRSMKCWSL